MVQNIFRTGKLENLENVNDDNSYRINLYDNLTQVVTARDVIEPMLQRQQLCCNMSDVYILRDMCRLSRVWGYLNRSNLCREHAIKPTQCPTHGVENSKQYNITRAYGAYQIDRKSHPHHPPKINPKLFDNVNDNI